MRNIFLALLISILLTGTVKAADITITIPDAKLQRVVDAMNGLSPKEDGFTDTQWAKEVIRRWLRDMVYYWETTEATMAAVGSISKDDEIVR